DCRVDSARRSNSAIPGRRLIMLISLISALLLATTPQLDVFKREMGPLQSAVDGIVMATGARVLQKSRAAYIDDYGIVVSLEIAYEQPQGIFDTPKKPAE